MKLVLDTETSNSFAYIRTELIRENEEAVEMQKRILSANKVHVSVLPTIKSLLKQRKE